MRRVARALGAEDAPSALYDLMLQLGTHTSLRDFSLNDSDLDRAADLAVANPYWNPRPVERAAVREMLQKAYDGSKPQETRP
jgi:maleylacetate reductase